MLNIVNEVFAKIVDFFDKAFWQNICISLGTFLLGWFVGFISRNVYLFAKLYNSRLFLTRKKLILIWNDHDINLSHNINGALKTRGPSFKYKEMKSPDFILRYPLSPQIIHMVILIVSDVTKLSDEESRRDKIQEVLINYVRKGGTLFGTHDLIYKRCRNVKLEEAYGCKITNFKRVSHPIDVTLNTSNHPLIKDLPQKFKLDDGELCWGNWGKGSEVLIRTENKVCNNNNNAYVYIPILVVRRIAQKGTLIWLNSADKGEKIANSLDGPQSEIIQILENAIKYSDEIK
jgi:hypothetical protein